VAKLGFVREPTNVASGLAISPSVTVEALDVNNNRVTNYATDIVMAIHTNPSGGTLSGTLTKTPASGVSEFDDVSINFFGTGYRLTATSGALTAAVSSTFNISATAISYDLPFTSITTPVYTSLYASSSWTNMEFVGDLVRLTPTAQADTAAVTGTMNAGAASGVVMGTLTDGVNSGLKLGSGGGCNGASSDCAKQAASEIYELSSSWTPQWASLVSYWKMNESSWNGTASEVLDSRGTTHGVRVGNTNTVNTSKLGPFAGSFDGSGDYINLGAYATLDGSTSFSVSTWIKPNVLPFVGWDGIVGRGSNGVRAFALYGYAGLSRVRLSIGTASGSDDCVIASSQDVALGVWNHVVATWNGINCYLYINGQLSADTDTSVSSVLSNTDGYNYIGHFAGNNTFNGGIDDLAIWKNTALSAEEVATIYNRQKTVYSGTFNSRIMDAKSSSSWTNLSWLTTLPFGKELPDAACSPGPTCTHSNSENSSAYSSLVGSTGATTDNNLMNGIVGLWHMNESSWADVAAEVKDDSGQGNHGRAKNGAQTANGKFLKGGSFDGVNDYISCGSGTSLDTAATFSLSAWVNSPDTSRNYQMVLTKSDGSGVINHELRFYGTGRQIQLVSTIGAGYRAVNGTTAMQNNTWYHLLATYDGAKMKVYVNGIFEAETIIAGVVTTTAAACNIGARANGAYPFMGKIDEAAIWNRALHADEAKQLYQRGASRLKYQVRTCNDNACADELWQGPDGTSGSFFSEINNTTSPLDGLGDVKKTSPSMLFSNFTTPPVSNQYFQYRAILESDSATAALMPELKSITVDPIHYAANSPSIYGNNGVEFSEINSFTENITTPASAATCPSGISYNLSLDKITWYWWDSAKASNCIGVGTGAWCASNNSPAQSNLASVIQTNAATFGTQVGRGTVYTKAYLNSTGLTKCELDSIHIGGDR
jgi:hypothetical protein